VGSLPYKLNIRLRVCTTENYGFALYGKRKDCIVIVFLLISGNFTGLGKHTSLLRKLCIVNQQRFEAKGPRLERLANGEHPCLFDFIVRGKEKRF
jgi:hypothetical protein